MAQNPRSPLLGPAAMLRADSCGLPKFASWSVLACVQKPLQGPAKGSPYFLLAARAWRDEPRCRCALDMPADATIVGASAGTPGAPGLETRLSLSRIFLGLKCV